MSDAVISYLNLTTFNTDQPWLVMYLPGHLHRLAGSHSLPYTLVGTGKLASHHTIFNIEKLNSVKSIDSQ
jgi:hypothetical protein